MSDTYLTFEDDKRVPAWRITLYEDDGVNPWDWWVREDEGLAPLPVGEELVVVRKSDLKEAGLR